MAHGDLAQTAAVVGALGSVLALVARRRLVLYTGLGLLTAAEIGLAVALVPSSGLAKLATPLRVVALVLAAAGVGAGAALFVRIPAAVPLAALTAAPFRPPTAPPTQPADRPLRLPRH